MNPAIPEPLQGHLGQAPGMFPDDQDPPISVHGVMAMFETFSEGSNDPGPIQAFVRGLSRSVLTAYRDVLIPPTLLIDEIERRLVTDPSE